jgi:hypothetical protein
MVDEDRQLAAACEVDEGDREGDQEVEEQSRGCGPLPSLEYGGAECAAAILSKGMPCVRTKVEVAVRSRTPESRPARNSFQGPIMRSSVHALSDGWGYGGDSSWV